MMFAVSLFNESKYIQSLSLSHFILELIGIFRKIDTCYRLRPSLRDRHVIALWSKGRKPATFNRLRTNILLWTHWKEFIAIILQQFYSSLFEALREITQALRKHLLIISHQKHLSWMAHNGHAKGEKANSMLWEWWTCENGKQ